MADLAAIRTGIATNLATISGLRTSATVPDNPSPPIAVVMPSRVVYDTAMARGLDTYEFLVRLIGNRITDRNAQNSLDAYLHSSGASSIKTAIESDRTLGGSVSDCRVQEMRAYGPLAIGEVAYLSADFIVQVIAP